MITIWQGLVLKRKPRSWPDLIEQWRTVTTANCDDYAIIVVCHPVPSIKRNFDSVKICDSLVKGQNLPHKVYSTRFSNLKILIAYSELFPTNIDLIFLQSRPRWQGRWASVFYKSENNAFHLTKNGAYRLCLSLIFWIHLNCFFFSAKTFSSKSTFRHPESRASRLAVRDEL